VSFRVQTLLSTTSVLTGLLVATNVWAADDQTLSGGALSGERHYRALTIDGELGVNSYDPDDAASGWVWIKAHQITITAQGSIVADGSGHPGSPTGGSGFGGEGGTPGLPDGTAWPGGGGAHVGAGGPGNDSICDPFLGAEGGPAYDTDSANPLALTVAQTGMGCAGGTSNSGPPNDWKGDGGNGGGVIILEAASVTLEGPISANGLPGLDTLNASPGGGGGGSILIHAAELVVGNGAALSAHGGLGATGNTYGGSGGGGLIVLWTDSEVTTLLSAADVAGGAGNGICTVNSTAGDPGVAILGANQGCNDADGDGYENVLCGGDDCDDGDPAINTNRTEICDGIDNDCDGSTDEEPNSICPAGQVCDTAADVCVEVESDGGTSSSGAAAGPEIELHGGLCASTQPLGSVSTTTLDGLGRFGPIVLLLAGLGVAGLVRRRTRP